MKKLIGVLFILCFTWQSYAASVDSLIIMSNAMNKSVKNVVIKPENYVDHCLP